MKRFATGLMVAAMLGSGMATLEAAKGGNGKGNGQSGTAAICSYLNSVITYPYVTYDVQQAALSLWASYGCATLQ